MLYSNVLYPSKIIEVNVLTVTAFENWTYDNGTGDPWLNYPYKWRLEITVSGNSHSSHLTRKQFVWNGLDIVTNNWISGTSETLACKIIKVESKTADNATIIVEDVNRFNTFNDSSGSGTGVFGFGPAIIFELGDDGLPVLNPLPSTTTAKFVSDNISRFRLFNNNHRYKITKTAHGFNKGDLVALTSSGVVKATRDTNRIIGSVIDFGPGEHDFFVNPRNKIVEKHLPALPGNIGDYVYVDSASPGELSNIENGEPIYLKLSDSIKSFITGIVVNPTITTGNILEINDSPITFSNNTLSSVISDINLLTTTHGVTASVKYSKTTITSTGSSPWTESDPTVSFSLNGTTISLTTHDQYGGTWSGIDDIIVDINALESTHGILAEDSGGYLKLTNFSGGPITIVDIDPAAPTGTNRKSFTEATGLSSVPASTDEVIHLEALDGREMIFQNNTGTPVEDLGIVSVDNGQLPIGLVIEQGVKKGEMYVVSDTTERDTLVVKTGDMAFVQDTGQGEWGLYVNVSSTWIELADHDSAKTDAITQSVTITHLSPTENLIYRVSDGSRLSLVTIEVTETFDGTDPLITVGDSVDNERFMDGNMSDLSSLGTYANTPSFQYDTGGLETEVYAYITPNGSTKGNVKVTISYS